MPGVFLGTECFLVRSRTSGATRQESIRASDSLVLFLMNVRKAKGLEDLKRGDLAG